MVHTTQWYFVISDMNTPAAQPVLQTVEGRLVGLRPLWQPGTAPAPTPSEAHRPSRFHAGSDQAFSGSSCC